jgi:hypothetical protein
MLGKSGLHARKLVAIACALFLVACAGTGEQAGYKQLTSADIGKVTQGMTRQAVEQELGRPRTLSRDRHGSEVLQYPYSATGYAYRRLLYVTIDSASGKVTQVTTADW